MKKSFFYLISVPLLLLLQSSLFGYFEIADVVPNLLLIMTASVATIEGSLDGCMVGFYCGILMDLAYGPILGMHALGYLLIGYLAGITNRMFYREDITFPLLIVAGSDLAYGVYMFLAGFLIRGRLHFASYLVRIILPEIVYTVIIAVFLYRIILFFLTRLSKK